MISTSEALFHAKGRGSPLYTCCPCPASCDFKQYQISSIYCDDDSWCLRTALSSTCISKREQINPRTSQGRQVLQVSVDGQIEVKSRSGVMRSQEESGWILELEILLPSNFWLQMKVHVNHGMWPYVSQVKVFEFLTKPKLGIQWKKTFELQYMADSYSRQMVFSKSSCLLLELLFFLPVAFLPHSVVLLPTNLSFSAYFWWQF